MLRIIQMSALIAFLAGGITGSAAAEMDSAHVFTVYVGPATIYGHEMALGPDGNVWFRSIGNRDIGFITPRGTVTDVDLPAGHGIALGISSGPDGNIWYADAAGSSLGRVVIGGAITNFPVPKNLEPTNVVRGGDGNLWFSARRPQAGHYSGPWWVGKMTTSGVGHVFEVLPGPLSVADIAQGPDGNIWFSDALTTIGRVTPNGMVTDFSTPPGTFAGLLAVGGDGYLYTSSSGAGGSTLIRIAPTGAMASISDPNNSSGFQTLAEGPDGNIWGSRICGNKTWYCLDVYIVNSGKFVEYQTPQSVPVIAGLVAGGDGNLWFQQFSRTRATYGLGRFTL
jgi:virginiamycin B lyase